MSRTGRRNVHRKSGRSLPTVGFGHHGGDLQGGDAEPQSANILT
jgi:hypothetical protein